MAAQQVWVPEWVDSYLLSESALLNYLKTKFPGCLDEWFDIQNVDNNYSFAVPRALTKDEKEDEIQVLKNAEKLRRRAMGYA